MGHGCGGDQALAASSHGRTVAIITLSSEGMFKTSASDARQASLAHFENAQDGSGVRNAGKQNFAAAEAAKWPMLKAALHRGGADDVYAGPNREWSRAILNWLDWQTKHDVTAAERLAGLRGRSWTIEFNGVATSIRHSRDPQDISPPALSTIEDDTQ